jgi:hypothetical protein
LKAENWLGVVGVGGPSNPFLGSPGLQCPRELVEVGHREQEVEEEAKQEDAEEDDDDEHDDNEEEKEEEEQEDGAGMRKL